MRGIFGIGAISAVMALQLMSCVSDGGDAGIYQPTASESYQSACRSACERERTCLMDRGFDFSACINECMFQGDPPWSDRYVALLGDTCAPARLELWSCTKASSCSALNELYDYYDGEADEQNEYCAEQRDEEHESCHTELSAADLRDEFSSRSNTLTLLCDTTCRLDAVCSGVGSDTDCQRNCAAKVPTAERHALLSSVSSECMEAYDAERQCLVGITCPDFRQMRELGEERAAELADSHPCAGRAVARQAHCTETDLTLIERARR